MTSTRVLFTRSFWLDAAERSIKAFGGGALGALTAGTIGSVAAPVVVLAGAVAAVTMLLLSIASAPVPALSPASVAPAGA